MPLTALFLSTSAKAQTYNYYSSDAVINASNPAPGIAIVGYGTAADYQNRTHPASPLVTLAAGGRIGSDTQVFNQSTFNISGDIGSFLYTFDRSQTNFSDGTITYDIYNTANSSLNMSGGTVRAIYGKFSEFFNLNTINITGGTVLDSVVGQAGSHDPGGLKGGTHINISGGTIAGGILVEGSSVVNLSGGHINFGLSAYNSSTLNFFGVNLNDTLINPDFVNINHVHFSQYSLSGNLADGTSINGKTMFIQNDTGASFHLFNAVPEPSSLALLITFALCGAGFLVRRRKQANKAA